MDTFLFIFCIILFFITSTIFIKQYNNSVRKKNKDLACHDVMNKKLFSIYGINCCVWNLSHLLIYFLFCYLIDAQLSIKKHLLVFIFGIIWYISCPYYKKQYYKCDNTCKNVYENTEDGRLDDIIFNTTGQLIYIFYYIVYIIKTK